MLINKYNLADNYKKILLLILFFLLLISVFSCFEKTAEKKVGRSFYYWKSIFKLNAFELATMDSLKITTIYLKLFDVDWDASTKQAIPKAKLLVKDKPLLLKFHIIPTVFISNSCIQQIDSLQTISLADKIHLAINDICKTNEINNIDEIQIDCDWTASTSKKYFSLLQYLKKVSNKNISATIRLHQIKFVSKSGVPPVDRGLLMCYNMGNLKNPATKNSIIETIELKKYIGNLSLYPLPLDVALPLFGWQVLFRDNVYKGLIENMPRSIFVHSFSLEHDGRIEILKDTLLAGYDFKKGDMLRNEESNISEIVATAEEINKRLKNTSLNLSLYHLDSVTLKKYSTHELESIYNSLH